MSSNVNQKETGCEGAQKEVFYSFRPAMRKMGCCQRNRQFSSAFFQTWPTTTAKARVDYRISPTVGIRPAQKRRDIMCPGRRKTDRPKEKKKGRIKRESYRSTLFFLLFLMPFFLILSLSIDREKRRQKKRIYLDVTFVLNSVLTFRSPS